jgi:hypothetical protein
MIDPIPILASLMTHESLLSGLLLFFAGPLGHPFFS